MCLYHVGGSSEDDREALLLTVEALKAQLEEQTRLCKEQVIPPTLVVCDNVYAW